MILFKKQIKKALGGLSGTPLIRLLNSEFNRYTGQRGLLKYSDEAFIHKKFQEKFGYPLNLAEPQTLNEKLQWLKLYYRDAEMLRCADKYLVRDFVRSKGLGHILNELHGVYESAAEIDYSSLPSEFIIKATHGSGFNILCRDRDTFKYPLWNMLLESWLSQSLYAYGREWVYLHNKPRIIIEKLMKPKQGKLLDYKFWCIGGELQFIQVSKYENGLKINLYDPEWRLMPEKYAFQNFSGKLEKPARFEDMKAMALKLSESFPFSRIDLYYFDNIVYFGEITFFPSSGFKKFMPHAFDRELGSRLRLPSPNHNPE